MLLLQAAMCPRPPDRNSKLTVCAKSIILGSYPYKILSFSFKIYALCGIRLCWNVPRKEGTSMEGTKPRTASSIGMFDMLKGAGMLTIVFAHTAELYPMQAVSGLSLTAFFPFIYREALMSAFFIASGYGFRKRSIHKCIHQQLKSLLKPYAYTALFTCVLHFIIHYKTFQYLPGTIGESIKVTGGFLLGLPHTAEYFGQEFFSCGPMWYLLALMVGWVLLDVILNIFPERYVPWAVAGCVLLGWGASLVWELPFCLI